MVKFKDFSMPLNVFQELFNANFIFKYFSRQSCVFKYFSSMCKPWYIHSPQVIGMVLEKILNNFTIYGQGGHLGHVTETICINLSFP